jgi:hypothetical protein
MSRFTRAVAGCNKNAELRSKIRQMFDIPVECDNQWNVLDEVSVDADTSLICVHNEQSVPNCHPSVRKLRGQIIETGTWTVVSDTTGAFEPLTVFSPLVKLDDKEGKYCVVTDAGEKTFSCEAKFYLGFESVKVRIFDFKGQRYFSTHTKIKAEKSRWTQDTFYTLFSKHVNPLTIEMPLSTVTGQRVNQLTFILLDPTLCLAGSYVAEKLMLLNADVPSDFLPNIERYSPVDIVTANDWIFPRAECVRSNMEDGTYCRQLFLKEEKEKGEGKGEGKGKVKVECNPFHVSPDPSLNDPRLMPGDFIVIEDGGEFTRLDTIRMRYTSNITGADPYPYHHFCIEAKKFIDSDETLKVLPQYLSSEGHPFNLKSYKERVQLWTIILWDAISPVHKSSVLSWYDRFFSDLKMVSHFIVYRYHTMNHEHLAEISDKRKILSRECLKNIDRIYEKTAHRIRPVKGTDFNTILCDSITTWLTFNETADSVYKLISSIGRYNRVFGTGNTPVASTASTTSVEAEAC